MYSEERGHDWNFFQLRDGIGAGYVKKLEVIGLQFHAHMHHFCEIILVLEGNITVAIEGSEYMVQSGSMIFIKPNQIHSVRTDDYSHSITCIFASEMIMAIADPMLRYSFFSPLVQNVPDFCRDLVNQLDDDAEIGITKGVLYVLSHYFYKQIDFTTTEQCGDGASLICKVIEYVDNHVENKISVQEMAKVLNYSPTYLSRYFYKKVGIPFSEYVNRVKIDHVCYMLRNTHDDIAAIADKCGFGSSSSFNRNFKEIVGCSPTEYREGHWPNKS